MRKLLSAVLVLLAFTTLLAGCGGDPAFAPASVNSSAAVLPTDEVLAALHARDYGTLAGMFREDLRASLPAGALAEALDPVLDEAGGVVGLSDTQTAPYTDPTYGELQIVVAAVEYENSTITWQISFSAGGTPELLGLIVAAVE